jgi:hypothetical protein
MEIKEKRETVPIPPLEELVITLTLNEVKDIQNTAVFDPYNKVVHASAVLRNMVRAIKNVEL